MSLPHICDTNLLPDGDMEAVGTSDWSPSSSAVLTKIGDVRPGSTGTQSMFASNFGFANPGFTANAGFEVGKTYRLTGWAVVSQAGGPQPFIYDPGQGTELWRGDAVKDAWQFFDVTYTNFSSGGPIFSSDANVFGQGSAWDDIWLCEVVSDSETVEKSYQYRVYDNNNSFITSWNDVTSNPEFNTYINKGPSEMVVSLARPFNDFGEALDVNFDNRVDVVVHDRDATTTSGMLLYSGFISGYDPSFRGSKEEVNITLLPYSTRLGFDVLTVSGGLTTQANFNSVDPSFIAETIFDNYTTTASGIVDYTASSVDSTGTVVSYDFNAATYRDAVEKVIELTPKDWYWRVDPDNTYYLKKKNLSADHTLSIGREVQDINIFKNSEQIVNVVLFTGGELDNGSPLYLEYRNTASIEAYGRRVRKVQDGRVTKESTAQTIAEKIINDKGVPDVRVRIVVNDNNIDRTFGYDIESFKVGETVSISDPDQNVVESLWDVSKFDEDFWDFAQTYVLSESLQINAISYSPDRVVLDLSSRNPEVAKRIQDVDRNLSNFINKDVEGSPS